MSRHHFHRADGGFVPDIEGTELPDAETARIEAVRFAAETIRDRPHFMWEHRDFRVEVTDEIGSLVCTVVVLGIDGMAARAT